MIVVHLSTVSAPNHKSLDLQRVCQCPTCGRWHTEPASREIVVSHRTDAEILENLRDEVVSQLRDAPSFPIGSSIHTRVSAGLVARAMAGDASLTLVELARVCDRVLVWDSLSFLDALEIEHDGDARATPTPDGWRRLRTLNGDRDFTYPLDTWST